MPFDADTAAHRIAEDLARRRLLKFLRPAPASTPNTRWECRWFIDPNTETLGLYINYLEARGLIERHHQEMRWIRILTPALTGACAARPLFSEPQHEESDCAHRQAAGNAAPRRAVRPRGRVALGGWRGRRPAEP